MEIQGWISNAHTVLPSAAEFPQEQLNIPRNQNSDQQTTEYFVYGVFLSKTFAGVN